MSLIKIDPAKAQATADNQRVVELRQLLADSDYKVLPDYDKPNEDIVAQREQWRTEVRALEEQT